MVKMTLLSLLGDGQPAFAIGTGAKTGSLGVSFALPAKGEKKGASAPRKARASSGMAVPDKPLGLVSSPATPHSNCRSTPNTSSCPLPALSTLHLCGEMEGEVTHHRCVCDLGARRDTAAALPLLPARPPGGAARNHGIPTPPPKAPCARMAARKIKSLEMGLTGAPAAGHSPALGSQASPPPLRRGRLRGRRAPSPLLRLLGGCRGPASAFGERLVLYEVLGMLEMVPLS